MRELIIYCDCCGKKIEGDPYKIFVEQVNREYGETLACATDEIEQNEKLCEKDWCVDCVRRMVDGIITAKSTTETDADEKANRKST